MRRSKDVLDRDKAACKDVDLDFFFPTGVTGRKPKSTPADHPRTVDEQERSNARFCYESDCEIIDQCREYAITQDLIGVWGGTSTIQRNTIRRRRRRERDSTQTA